MSEPVDRQVKGGRASFYKDADVDRLLAMLTRLMSHHWTLTERVKRLETLLEENGIISPNALGELELDPAADGALDAESHAFIKDVMGAARNIKR